MYYRAGRFSLVATLVLLLSLNAVLRAQTTVGEKADPPCATISGTYENTGPIVDGPERHRLRTGLHWRVFDGARLDFPGLNGKIDAVRLEAVDGELLRVFAIDRDGTRVGPYLLGSRAPWRCIDEAFINETDAPLAGEGNAGDMHEKTSMFVDTSGSLVYETITTIQRRTAFLLGGKVGKAEVTRRAFVFQRIR
ncbi:hypothetical protein [Casimicrobium huifangae]|uniref:hypothetical protein n=1 Tax=Casimicrobium huifangae TaxID=2591109 RepID=UPI0012ECB3B1|nr:hypothetical protein [Casimicrobium huifangae]